VSHSAIDDLDVDYLHVEHHLDHRRLAGV